MVNHLVGRDGRLTKHVYFPIGLAIDNLQLQATAANFEQHAQHLGSHVFVIFWLQVPTHVSVLVQLSKARLTLEFAALLLKGSIHDPGKRRYTRNKLYFL